MDKSPQQKTKKPRRFALGYSMVFYAFLSYLFYMGLTTTGLNVIAPTFAAQNQLDPTAVLSVSSIGGLFAIVTTFVSAHLIMKKGIRIVATISMIVCGLAGTMALGFVSSLAGYTLCVLIGMGIGCGYSQGTAMALIAIWFPRTKGYWLGISTIGISCSALIMIPLLNYGFANHGFRATMVFMGAALTLLGVISWFWLRNSPEEVGLLPDNKPLSDSEKQKMDLQGAQEGGGWTVAGILKNKQSWLIIVCFGFSLLVVTASGSTTIPLLMELGFAQNDAVMIFSIFSVVGMLGSFAIGWLDTRFGTKLANITYFIIGTAGFLIFVLWGKQPWGLFSFLALAQFAGGAISNLIPSTVGTCFGRRAFASVNRVLWTIISIPRALSFIFVAAGISLTGSYRGAYFLMTGASIIGLVLSFLIDYSKTQRPTKAAGKTS